MLSTEVILRRCGPYLSYTCRVCLNFQPERGPGNCCSCSCRCGCCYYYCYVLLLNLSTHPMPTLHHRNSATAQTATAYKTLFNQRFQHLPPELNTTRRAYLKTQRPPTHQPVVVPVARSSNHPPARAQCANDVHFPSTIPLLREQVVRRTNDTNQKATKPLWKAIELQDRPLSVQKTRH